jgi:hypothetical protein
MWGIAVPEDSSQKRTRAAAKDHPLSVVAEERRNAAPRSIHGLQSRWTRGQWWF